jgi:selenium metabolism protein YedF
MKNRNFQRDKKMKELDVRGLACPEPVILTKKAIEAGETEILVVSDSTVAVENIQSLAKKMNFNTEVVVDPAGKEFRLHLTQQATPQDASVSPDKAGKRVVFLISSQFIGRGEDPLGEILLKSFLKTILELPLPEKLVFLNTGVKLTIEGAPTINALKEIESRGVEIMVCGTCLDYFQVKDKVAVGRVSNFLEIAESMLNADKVVSF